MPEIIAIAILVLIGAYGVAGIVVGMCFVFGGIGTVDPGANHAPLGFRLIVLPGAAALWPWALLKWRAATRFKHTPGSSKEP